MAASCTRNLPLNSRAPTANNPEKVSALSRLAGQGLNWLRGQDLNLRAAGYVQQ